MDWSSDYSSFLSRGSRLAHFGVTCDGCGAQNFSGRRFKCSVCYDYDLCNDCAMRGVTTKEHESNHPMDHLAPVPPHIPLGSTYSCPYCKIPNLTEPQLCEHVLVSHADDPKRVVCPICASKPGGDASFVSSYFQGHLQTRHAPLGRGLKRPNRPDYYSDFVSKLQFRRNNSGLSINESPSKRGENDLRKSTDPPKIMRLSGVSLDPEPITDEDKLQREKDEKLRSIFIQDILFSSLCDSSS